MAKLMILCTTPDERLEMVLKEAGKLGYETVFCGEKEYEPVRQIVDAFYVTDWSDITELVKIAKDEQIDGIVGLCDAVMTAVAKVAEELKLPGNPPKGIEKMISKSGFRGLQKEAGVFCPRNVIYETAMDYSGEELPLHYPVIVKPVLSSSSHGMTVLQNEDGLKEALCEAAKFSRNGAVSIEEFVENDSLRIIEADVFVVGEDILWDGVRFSYRLENAPLRPAYDVYPVVMSEEEEREFKHTIEAILKTAKIRLGEYNVEGYFTKEGRFFILEINPRQAGHYNPQNIETYCGLNLTKLLITTAVGDMSYYEEQKTMPRLRRNVLTYSIFSMEDGVLDHIYIDPGLREKMEIMRYLHGQKEGDAVLNIVDAVRPIAQAVFVFDSAEELEAVRVRLTDRVYAVLK